MKLDLSKEKTITFLFNLQGAEPSQTETRLILSDGKRKVLIDGKVTEKVWVFTVPRLKESLSPPNVIATLEVIIGDKYLKPWSGPVELEESVEVSVVELPSEKTILTVEPIAVESATTLTSVLNEEKLEHEQDGSFESWDNIESRYTEKYGKNHHHLKLTCAMCSNVKTCRCSNPKIDEVGVCPKCADISNGISERLGKKRYFVKRKAVKQQQYSVLSNATSPKLQVGTTAPVVTSVAPQPASESIDISVEDMVQNLLT